jgi:hypothetical protein
MLIMFEVCYGYYIRSVLWLLCKECVMVIMLEPCYGNYVSSRLLLLC